MASGVGKVVVAWARPPCFGNSPPLAFSGHLKDRRVVDQSVDCVERHG